MPILVHGVNGSGKTAFTLGKLSKSFPVDSTFYWMNINDCRMPGWTRFDDITKWMELPEGSVLVIDEAQEIFPVRPVESAPPDWIQQLTQHRVRGIEIVLLTQHPANLDAFVRRLVHRQIYLYRPNAVGGCRVFEWSDFEENFKSISVQDRADKYTWKFDPEVFTHYTSTKKDTFKFRMPKALKWLPILGVIIVAGASYQVYQWDKMKGHADTHVKGMTDQLKNGMQTPAMFTQDTKKAPDFDPTDPMGFAAKNAAAAQQIGLPWLDPKYKKFQEPKRAPYPTACIVRSGDTDLVSCRCYTDDGTIIENVNVTFCRDFVAGRVFAFWRAPANNNGNNDGTVQGPVTQNGTKLPADTSGTPPTQHQPVSAPPMDLTNASVTGHRSGNFVVTPTYR